MEALYSNFNQEINQDGKTWRQDGDLFDDAAFFSFLLRSNPPPQVLPPMLRSTGGILLYCFVPHIILGCTRIRHAAAQVRNDSLFLPNPFGDTMRELQEATTTEFLTSLAYDIVDEDSPLPSPFTLQMFWDSGSTEMSVVTDDLPRIYVVFRGTDQTIDGDWATNLNVFQTDFGPPEGPIVNETIYDTDKSGDLQEYGIRVHRGFNGALFRKRLYGNVTSVLEGLLAQHGSNTVHVTGHSLGGANAQLFGTYYAYNNPDIDVYVTTFGSPRVGNYGFKVLANSLPNLNVWRFVYKRDLVPRNPVSAKGIRYHHAGHVMYKEPCDQEDDSSCDGPVVAYYRQTGDPEQGLDGIGSVFFTLAATLHEEESIWDHFIPKYSEWLRYANLDIRANYTCGFVGEQDAQCTEADISGASSTFWIPKWSSRSLSSLIRPSVTIAFTLSSIMAFEWVA